jgi:hypothetical protein
MEQKRATNEKQPLTIPYVVYENTVTRHERRERILTAALCAVSALAVIGTAINGKKRKEYPNEYP